MTLTEFHDVINKTVSALEMKSKSNPSEIAMLDSGEKFQKYVSDIVSKYVKQIDPNADVQNKPNSTFPDIIIVCSDGKKYGIEVKSSKDNNAGWSIPGNSVNESTLEPDLDEIQLIFGKTHPARQAFRSGKYENYVKEVRTTHYPRFIVDMDTKPSDNFFKKIGIPFQDFSELGETQRLQTVKDFYLSKGEYYWWLSDDAGSAIVLYENLPTEKKKAIYAYAFVHYPEVLSGKSNKYKRLAAYIASSYGAISPSLRDQISAKGKGVLVIKNGHKFVSVPRVYLNMYTLKDMIQKALSKAVLKDLKKEWGEETKAGRKKQAWVEVMMSKASTNTKDNLSESDRKSILNAIIND